MQSDCNEIITFYKINNLPFMSDNCCQWTNIECNDNNNIKTFQFKDDRNVEIDFSKFPILSELSELIIQGKYLLRGSVPYSFLSQPKLISLMLENSNIWDFPNNINSFSSSSIEILSLKNNLLTIFPYYFSNMPNLRSLNLSENKISEQLTDEIKRFPSLEILDISSNFIKGNLPDMPSNLKELNIENNQFESLNFSSSQSPNLEIFNGNKNKLGDQSFQRVTEFSNLKHISLEDTGLTVIPETIGSLENLRYLSLKNNDIKILPEEFNKLYLDELNLSDNPNLNGQIKNGTTINKCTLGHTEICLENSSICNKYDSISLCYNNSKGFSFSTWFIIFLIAAIIILLAYIIHYLFKFKKENDIIKGFSLMPKHKRGTSMESIIGGNKQSDYPTLKSRTSKEVINSINEAVSHLSTENDTKARNAEIAFSNGMKIVGSANEAFNLSKNKNQQYELKEIFNDVDSIDEDITDHLSTNPEDEMNANEENKDFSEGFTVPSLNRSVISNPSIMPDRIIPNYTAYSLPRNYNNRDMIVENRPENIHFNTVMNHANPYNLNTQNFINMNEISANNVAKANGIKIQTRPRSRSSLANANDNIMNNNMNILRMNARDTIMPGVRQGYATEYTNKLNNMNLEMPSHIYTNGLLNAVNDFKLEKFNNYHAINNDVDGRNNQIQVLTKNTANNNNDHINSTGTIILPYSVGNTSSLKRNQLNHQNKTINLNSEINNGVDSNRKAPMNVALVPNPSLNNAYMIKYQDNLPTLVVNSSAKPVTSINHNMSLASSHSNSNTDTNTTNLTSLFSHSTSLSLSSTSMNNTSFSDDELNKNIMFQNPTTTSLGKSNSKKTSHSNHLLPIFNHQDSIKSVGNTSNSSGNMSSSLDLHMDSSELDEIFNDISSSK